MTMATNRFILIIALLLGLMAALPAQAQHAPGRTGVELSQAYPNPFSAKTQFTLSVDQSQRVRVEVFDLLGRRVATLHDGLVSARQPVQLTLEASNLPGGLYVYRATGDTFQVTRRVTLSR
jgi:hypothetical protein